MINEFPPPADPPIPDYRRISSQKQTGVRSFSFCSLSLVADKPPSKSSTDFGVCPSRSPLWSHPFPLPLHGTQKYSSLFLTIFSPPPSPRRRRSLRLLDPLAHCTPSLVYILKPIIPTIIDFLLTRWGSYARSPRPAFPLFSRSCFEFVHASYTISEPGPFLRPPDRCTLSSDASPLLGDLRLL